MIRVSNNTARVMEFTSFKKKDTVTDDELLTAVLNFESTYLAKQAGVILHCLVRNSNNEYANVMFLESMETLKELEKGLKNSEEANLFFTMIEEGSVQMNFHQIHKENFEIPSNFSCVEFGSFSLKNSTFDALLKASESIEDGYLNKFDNTKGHFIGTLSEDTYSEVTFGKTLGKTKEICAGYIGNTYCQPLLDMADETTMKLDFWYLIA